MNTTISQIFFDLDTSFGRVLMIFLLGIVPFLFAHFIGRKRQIGFAWCFFFFCCFTVIGGLIITFLSKKYYDKAPKKSKAKKIIGWILAIFWGYKALFVLPHFYTQQISLLVLIGFCGLGFYLIEIGKGKIPNKTTLGKISTTNELLSETRVSSSNGPDVK